MRPSIFLPFLVACIAYSTPHATGQTEGPRPNEIVQSSAYISMEPVPRGRTFEIGVVAHIRDGYHVNAHKPSLDYLIPTEVRPSLPQGITLSSAIYPEGQMLRFPFSATLLRVYEGNVVFRLRLVAEENAPLGSQEIPMQLEYQACNDHACLPPVKIRITAHLEIAPAGAASTPMHPEVFSPSGDRSH